MARAEPDQSRWRVWGERSSGDRAAFFRAALFLALTRIALRAVGFAAVRRVLDASPVESEDARADEARAVARSVERAARHLPFRSSCLDRAVALCWLLRLDLLGGTLRIGVHRREEGLAAHAWVERRGERLLDDGDGAFEPFDDALLGGNR